MRKTRWMWRILVGVVASLGMQMSYAVNTTAVVVTGCTLTGPAAMVFNTNLLLGLQSTTSFNLKCTVTGTTGNGVKITIDLSAGSSGSVLQRNQKKGATDVLTYNLYQDSLYKSLWGNASSNQVSVTVGSAGLDQTFTIYGKIDSTTANQSEPVGTYSDPIITATVNWP